MAKGRKAETVIDFSYHFEAPLGYDLSALLMNTYYFWSQDTSPTEMNRVYESAEYEWEKLLEIGWNDIEIKQSKNFFFFS